MGRPRRILLSNLDYYNTDPVKGISKECPKSKKVKSRKNLRVKFIDQVDKRKKIAQIINIQSYKKYMSHFEIDENKFSK